MEVRWKKLITSLVVWLASEIVLNFSGLDNLADYGEFIFTYRLSSIVTLAEK